MPPQEIIVYRSPLEKALWDLLFNLGDLIYSHPIICGAITGILWVIVYKQFQVRPRGR